MEMPRRHRSTYKGDRAQIMALPDPVVCALVRERAALLHVGVAQYAGDVLSEHVGLDHLVRELHGLDLGNLPPAVPDSGRPSYVEALEAPSFVKAIAPREVYNVIRTRATMLGISMGRYVGDVLCVHVGMPELMTDLYRFDLNELDLTVDAPGRSEGLPLAI
ncbi:hypothetical protein BTO20_37000 (plasmid) [Mycobacterium dioxanotrophicus]|uniref:Uncharacterized protein n=1 Tax=Mycobacterium dioxanotrophicus TaxID=482462 RepID=A0A1Y0CG69_9MYCO|nr:hypothetical protein [Mycobacterium dioxanotrophicus]ART74250.1 hypothetical protein BTO20_37000 [Mycobacterium dioxanotrophicus]